MEGTIGKERKKEKKERKKGKEKGFRPWLSTI